MNRWHSPILGVDMGAFSTVICAEEQGIILREPSVVAIEKSTSQIIAAGASARRMLGRTPGGMEALRPLRSGLMNVDETVFQMLAFFLRNSLPGGALPRKPRIALCIPACMDEMSRQQLIEGAQDTAAVRQTFLIESPVAAAIGADVSIDKPYGSLVLDIGGSSAEIAITSLGQAVLTAHIPLGGDSFDAAIVERIRHAYGLMLGETAAEELKRSIGALFPFDEVLVADVPGKSLSTGLPDIATVSSDELMEALIEPVPSLIEFLRSILEKAPPELAADIFDRGITMTGGGSLLPGLDICLSENLHLPTHIAKDPESAAARGALRALENPEIYGNCLYGYHKRTSAEE